MDPLLSKKRVFENKTNSFQVFFKSDTEEINLAK